MQIAIVDSYFQKRYSFFEWRTNMSFAKKIALSLSMACITGILAQVVIPLPWTPVPITGQTFAVLLVGILLGRYWGGISQAFYVGIGVAGFPWFAGLTGGYGALLGATGGYLIGFIFAALFLGYFTDRYIRARSFIPMFGLMLFANFVLIYIPGLLVLGTWIYLVKGSVPGIWTLLLMGVAPFVIGDLVKIWGAATVTKAITPKQAFNGEVDVERARKWQLF
ncbi:MAG: biotin transporter BioY [Euryarchaeota archaeon]|nr:biotin transporter BioY [Euryarchaeota archaeon]